MTADFFTRNRRALTDRLHGELVIFTAYTAQQQSGDGSFPFVQEANFLYLTGIRSADWLLVIDGAIGRSLLIAPETDAVHQIFNGNLSTEEAKHISGIDEVVGMKEGAELLESLAKKHKTIYTLGTPPYAEFADFALNPAQAKLNLQLEKKFESIKDCRKTLGALRAIKQPAEIDEMQDAVKISIEAFEIAKAKLPSLSYEYEVEAELSYHFRRHNASHAFEPIVASGKNACTLHYTNNASQLQSGLLLIDAGASKQGYPADITRTFAVGELTERHRTVHAAVKEAEERIIQLLAPDLELKTYTEKVDGIMEEALLQLGLMKNSDDTTAYRRYFPHAISHGLGLDVHESLGGFERLQAGMVLTVEPGIYIPEENIGVRIEDDILITDNGYCNLTAELSTEL